jgi:nucleotide-binding universal stress UspA family protein
VQDPAGINERERAQAILRHADEIDAFAIVLGARGRSGLGSILVGDVAGDVVQLANRPVFVVPSTALADRRRVDRTG